MNAPAHHRPWPLPRGPWIMAQRWHDLLFAHWPVPVAALRPIVPAPLQIDTWDGQAWIGVVPFRMTGVRPRGVPPLPWLSAFPELNVRTYVTDGDGPTAKPGVFFFSLDAANWLAAAAARWLYQLPYYHARMALRCAGDVVEYRSYRVDIPPADLRARYRPTGPIQPFAPGSLDRWLTERYCLYTLEARGRIYRAEIHHAPWPLQPAEAEFEVNTMVAPLGVALPPAPPLLHFARRQDVIVWPLQLVWSKG